MLKSIKFLSSLRRELKAQGTIHWCSELSVILLSYPGAHMTRWIWPPVCKQFNFPVENHFIWSLSQDHCSTKKAQVKLCKNKICHPGLFLYFPYFQTNNTIITTNSFQNVRLFCGAGIRTSWKWVFSHNQKTRVPSPVAHILSFKKLYLNSYISSKLTWV